MNLILASGKEIVPAQIIGFETMFQGKNRDALKFGFVANNENTLDSIDALFTPTACKSIKIVDDDMKAYVHQDYTLRVSLAKEPFQLAKATSESPEISEDRIYVTMARVTYEEALLESLTETVDILAAEALTEA